MILYVIENIGAYEENSIDFRNNDSIYLVFRYAEYAYFSKNKTFRVDSIDKWIDRCNGNSAWKVQNEVLQNILERVGRDQSVENKENLACLKYELKFLINIAVIVFLALKELLIEEDVTTIVTDVPPESDIGQVLTGVCSLYSSIKVNWLGAGAARPIHSGTLDRFSFSTYPGNNRFLNIYTPDGWDIGSYIHDLGRSLRSVFHRSEYLRTLFWLVITATNSLKILWASRLFQKESVTFVMSNRLLRHVIVGALERKKCLIIDSETPPPVRLLIKTLFNLRVLYFPRRPRLFFLKGVSKNIPKNHFIGGEDYVWDTPGPLPPNLTQYLYRRSVEHIFSLMPTLEHRLDQLNKFFQRHTPAAILLPYDAPFLYKSACSIGKKLHIPTVVSLHGIPGDQTDDDRRCADHVAVWGEAYKDMLADPSSGQKFYCWGSLAFDPIRPTLKLRGVTVQSVPVRDILILTTNAPIDNGFIGCFMITELTLVRVLRALNQGYSGQSINFRLRPHPGESRRYIRRLLNSEGLVHIKLDSYDDPIESVLASDMVISLNNSSLALEAAYAGKKVLNYNPRAIYKRDPYLGPFPLDNYYSLDDFVRASVDLIKKELTVPIFDCQISGATERYVGPIETYSTDRHIDGIEAITSKKVFKFYN